MAEKFPELPKSPQLKIEDNKVTFSYTNSFGKVITETKPILSSKEISDRVKARMDRFHKAGPAVRESETSKAERKWLSAHPENLLEDAFDLLDEHGKMEFSMMFSRDSHRPHADPNELKKEVKESKVILGDNEKGLNMPVHSPKQYRFMQMMARSPQKKKSKGAGPSPDVAREMISRTSKGDRSKFAKSNPGKY
jgi:hypothetical protein